MVSNQDGLQMLSYNWSSLSNIANTFLRLLSTTALLWCYTCFSGQRWPFCTMTGRCWRTTTWARPTGWWQRRTWTYLSTWTRMTGGEKNTAEAHSNDAVIKWFWLYFCFLGGRRELRTLVIEMVMSTDMSCHFQQIKTMKSALSQTDKSELKTRPFRNLHTTSINMTKPSFLQSLALKIFYKSSCENNLPHLQAK